MFLCEPETYGGGELVVETPAGEEGAKLKAGHAVLYPSTTLHRVEPVTNGVRLVVRSDGWLPLGSCPVRFEGETGWVETGDDGELVASAPELIAAQRTIIAGYPANFHVRNFLDCVKSRAQPRVNAVVACQSHIACHAGNIALFLDRRLVYDPERNVFPHDEEANRLRSEALREPWRV